MPGMQNKEEFTQVRIKELLAGLKENTKPLWGMMTPQHMVEHLTVAVKASTGRIKSMVVTPPDKIKAVRQHYLEGDELWERGMKNPLLPEDRLVSLKYATLQEAKEKLIQAVGEFEAYYAAHPDAVEANPFTGYMHFNEWKQFHFKHFRHHFIQFGLLKNLYEN